MVNVSISMTSVSYSALWRIRDGYRPCPAYSGIQGKGQTNRAPSLEWYAKMAYVSSGFATGASDEADG
jgi:hypothetical protein